MNSHRRQIKNQKIKGGRHLPKKQPRRKNSYGLTNLIIKRMSLVILLAILVSVTTITAIFFSSDSSKTLNLMALEVSNSEELTEETQDHSISLMAINLKALNVNHKQKAEQEESIQAEDLIQLHEEFKANLDSECEALEENDDVFIAQMNELYELGEEIKSLYDSVKEAKVCSKANKFNNSLQEEYIQFSDYFYMIEGWYSQYKEKYIAFEQHVDEFNSGSHLKSLVEINSPQDQYNVYMKYFFGVYDEFTYANNCTPIEEVSATMEELMQYNEEILAIASSAQQIADEFFDLVFYDMSHIGNAEAGSDWLPPEDIYYVLNVIENRVESPKFRQNTVHDVIFAPGQYTPVKSGSFYLEPTDQVKERTENYLRGYVDTGMPSDVVFQAKGRQGDGVWKYMKSSGHYFCYKKGA